ncbi:hypothetical protein ABIC09_005846 [Bradyrhizobium sp. S3.12.5]|uniref:hypothetical protein n=1 Tax=Bradyrhizobium sp. S3.12.5 TaxID=3156386 RepID=UPI003392D9CF
MTYRAPISDMLLSLNNGAGLKAAMKAGHYSDSRRHRCRGAGGGRQVRNRRAGAARREKRVA